MRIIDTHGAHVLDFERFHLDNNQLHESKALGYSVLDSVRDIRKFLQEDSKNYTTILPPPSPIFNQMNDGKFDFDLFPFHYENTQLFQIMTFLSRLGLEKRVIPYLGFSTSDDSNYLNYLERILDKTPCGFKFHPLAMQTPISSLEGSPVIELASERRMPVLVHTGGDDYSDSRQLIRMAEIYPNINFCAAHFGYFRKEFLEALASLPNLFTDTSILTSLLSGIKMGNEKHADLKDIPKEVRTRSREHIFSWIVENYQIEGKIMFGSDIMWTYHVNSDREKEIDFAEKLDYPQTKKEQWFYKNALRFLRDTITQSQQPKV